MRNRNFSKVANIHMKTTEGRGKAKVGNVAQTGGIRKKKERRRCSVRWRHGIIQSKTTKQLAWKGDNQGRRQQSQELPTSGKGDNQEQGSKITNEYSNYEKCLRPLWDIRTAPWDLHMWPRKRGPKGKR